MQRTSRRGALFALLLLVAAGHPAAARMYQWTDPGTGTPQLSGKPPAWYRDGNAGPRVMVYENGRLIDDTARSVSEPERNRLREEALIQAEKETAALSQKLQEAQRMQAMMNRMQPTGQEAEEEPEIPVPAPAPERASPSGDTTQQTIDQMRAIIESWEERQADKARQTVEGATP